MYAGTDLLADWILNYLTNTPKHTHTNTPTYDITNMTWPWPDLIRCTNLVNQIKSSIIKGGSSVKNRIFQKLDMWK